MVMLLIATLATWRVSSLVAEEEGPWNMFVELRLRVTNKIFGRKGASCVWCMSVYIAAAMAAWLTYFGQVPLEMSPVWWLALSGGAITLHSTLDRILK